MSDVTFPAIATDDIDHLRGDEARTNNIAAARAVGEAVRSTLGPSGLDKMLVSSQGAITVTNDGKTILNEMDVNHPAARTLVEVAKAQVAEVGDGSTTSVLLASELLHTAESLFEQDVHPTVVVDGYQHAVDQSLAELDSMAEQVAPDDPLLRQVAESSLTGKVVSPNAGEIASLIVDATQAVTVDGTVDVEYLKTLSKSGGAVGESQFHHGAVVDTDPCHESMPTDLPDADVLLVHEDIDMVEPENDVKANFDSPECRNGFIERDEQWTTDIVEHLADIGATVVLCHGRVNEFVAQRLASRGILAIEHIDRAETEFAFLREVTGAAPVVDPLQATREELGTADVSRDGMFFIENPETHGITLVLQGTTESIAAEVERSVMDSIDIVSRTVSDGRVLPGGGAPEVELAARLRDHATEVDGRMQLAFQAFADSLEVIPRSLAKNAGMNPLDTLIDLRTAHASGRTKAGLDVTAESIEDMSDAEVIQPAYVSEQSIYNAAKAAAIILKVDETISAGHLSHTGEDSD